MKEFLEKNQDHFHFIFRVIIGLLFILHGTMKWSLITGMQFSNLMFYAGIIEIVGGLFLVIGLFVRWTAVVAALEMTYAFIVVHTIGSGTINPVGEAGNGGEAALLFLVSFLVIAATGPTAWSVHKE